MKWELKLKKARDLKKQGAELLHERAKLLCECYADERFLDDCCQRDTNVLEVLDAEVQDLGVDFLTLKAVLDHNADLNEWVTHGFRYLLAEYYQSIKPEPKPREQPSYKQLYEQLKKENEILKGQIRVLQQAIAGHAMEQTAT